jgi:O-methyltransferase involved in polyketide biosynthesis
VRHARGGLTYWGFGGGFDARWYRLKPALHDVIRVHCEVEEPEVMAFKNQALADSSFAQAWDRIHRLPIREDRWTVHDPTLRSAPGPSEHTLVVLEGVASRIGIEGLKRLLGRVRRDAPAARVIVDLPGILQSATPGAQAMAVGSARSRWASPIGTGASALRTRELARLGWQVHEDVWFAARPELRAPSGMAICSGMEALRVLCLGATPEV